MYVCTHERICICEYAVGNYVIDQAIQMHIEEFVSCAVIKLCTLMLAKEIRTMSVVNMDIIRKLSKYFLNK